MPVQGEILSLGHDPVLLAARHSLFASAGHRVTSAVGTKAALNLVYSHRFDLLVVGCIGQRESTMIEYAAKQIGMPVLLLCCRISDAVGDLMTCADVFDSPVALLQAVAASMRQRVSDPS